MDLGHGFEDTPYLVLAVVDVDRDAQHFVGGAMVDQRLRAQMPGATHDPVRIAEHTVDVAEPSVAYADSRTLGKATLLHLYVSA